MFIWFKLTMYSAVRFACASQ